MTEYVSSDLGSSFCKVSNGDSKVRFPSIVQGSRPGNGICVGGAWYVVGRDAIDAQLNPRTDPQAIAKYHGSASQLILLCDAMRRMGYDDAHGIELLMLGLPFGMHRDAAVCKRVEQMCQLLSWHQPDFEGEIRVTPRRVRIVPQGLGTLRLFAEQHPDRAQEGSRIAVADVGGQTTDVINMEVEEGGTPRFIGGCSRAIGINVLEFYRMLLDDMQDKTRNAYVLKRDYHFHDVMERVRHGRLLFQEGPGGPEHDATDNVARVRRAWTMRLQAAVQEVIGSRWSDLSAMVLTGGGAALVDENTWQGPVVTMGDTANVDGQILIMRQQGG